MMLDHQPTETAWRIHAAHVEWISKVDTKSSFALTIEAAMFAGVLATDLRGLGTGASRFFFWAGSVVLVASLFSVAYAVTPHLRKRQAHKESADNFVYFGHVLHWNSDDLQVRLENTNILPVLSRQLVALAKVAWRKHLLLQYSLSGAAVAGVLFAVSALTR